MAKSKDQLPLLVIPWASIFTDKKCEQGHKGKILQAIYFAVRINQENIIQSAFIICEFHSYTFIYWIKLQLFRVILHRLRWGHTSVHMRCGQYESPSFLGSKRHCSAVSSHTVSKCPFCGPCSASFFACLCFWLEIGHFQGPPNRVLMWRS